MKSITITKQDSVIIHELVKNNKIKNIILENTTTSTKIHAQTFNNRVTITRDRIPEDTYIGRIQLYEVINLIKDETKIDIKDFVLRVTSKNTTRTVTLTAINTIFENIKPLANTDNTYQVTTTADTLINLQPFLGDGIDISRPYLGKYMIFNESIMSTLYSLIISTKITKNKDFPPIMLRAGITDNNQILGSEPFWTAILGKKNLASKVHITAEIIEIGEKELQKSLDKKTQAYIYTDKSDTTGYKFEMHQYNVRYEHKSYSAIEDFFTKADEMTASTDNIGKFTMPESIGKLKKLKKTERMLHISEHGLHLMYNSERRYDNVKCEKHGVKCLCCLTETPTTTRDIHLDGNLVRELFNIGVDTFNYIEKIDSSTMFEPLAFKSDKYKGLVMPMNTKS